jgi:NADH dehydrogenase [ubiquinone] 1 alpha subcomplex assembly factor 7
VRDKIFAAIDEAGPLPFDRYMDMCLYDPDEGFFGSGRGAPGKDADFLTSPETSALFGMLVGLWALDTAHPPGTPLIEVGAGSGALLAELADMWLGDGPLYAVERSPAARANLASRFPAIGVLDSLDGIPATDGVVIIANEVLDNMPAALAVMAGNGWIELGVDRDGDGLIIMELPARPEVVAWCTSVYPDASPGQTVTAQVVATRWIEETLRSIPRVSMCLIDYAETSAVLSGRPMHQLVRAYRKHRSSDEWLSTPGETDLTVDVNVDGVSMAVAAAGGTLNVLSQRSFLLDQGAEEDLADLSYAEVTAASEGRIMDQLIARSKRIDLEAVLDPSGLGGFSVFLIEKGTR